MLLDQRLECKLAECAYRDTPGPLEPLEHSPGQFDPVVAVAGNRCY